MRSYADRAGELSAERRHARDERNQRCCKKPDVWDDDPAMHPGARVPDLVALDEPPARVGLLLLGTIASRRLCPEAALAPSC